MPHRIASAKIPEALLEAVDQAARQRGLTRNAYMRRALEAATDGTLELQSDAARTRALVRARFAADAVAMSSLSLRGQTDERRRTCPACGSR